MRFVPGVIRAAGYFPEVNHGVLSDPRLRVIIDDGRNHLLVTEHTYDVVSVDTLDPKHAGNGNLYTREFYALSRRVLRPGGIFVQWLPYHQVDNASLKLIARTFLDVYPHATLWLNRFKGYALLVGTLGPLRIDVGRLDAVHSPLLQRGTATMTTNAKAKGWSSVIVKWIWGAWPSGVIWSSLSLAPPVSASVGAPLALLTTPISFMNTPRLKPVPTALENASLAAKRFA